MTFATHCHSVTAPHVAHAEKRNDHFVTATWLEMAPTSERCLELIQSSAHDVTVPHRGVRRPCPLGCKKSLRSGALSFSGGKQHSFNPCIAIRLSDYPRAMPNPLKGDTMTIRLTKETLRQLTEQEEHQINGMAPGDVTSKSLIAPTACPPIFEGDTKLWCVVSIFTC